MIDREHGLPLTHQADLLDLSRSSLYYTPVPVSHTDLEMMRRIDHLHTEYRFMGARATRTVNGTAAPDCHAVKSLQQRAQLVCRYRDIGENRGVEDRIAGFPPHAQSDVTATNRHSVATDHATVCG